MTSPPLAIGSPAEAWKNPEVVKNLKLLYHAFGEIILPTTMKPPEDVIAAVLKETAAERRGATRMEVDSKKK